LHRYKAGAIGGATNPRQTSVVNDAVDAILEQRAANGKLAVYRPQEDQKRLLQAMYDKWAAVDGVWSQAAAQIHKAQITHVRKGCLARTRNNVLSGGSRIEGTHKQWNAVMRTFASGLPVFLALSND
ncbi:hypothetical protein FA95DRAFT_1470207, partial [Auriscalpium vulgare]